VRRQVERKRISEFAAKPRGKLMRPSAAGLSPTPFVCWSMGADDRSHTVTPTAFRHKASNGVAARQEHLPWWSLFSLASIESPICQLIKPGFDDAHGRFSGHHPGERRRALPSSVPIPVPSAPALPVRLTSSSRAFCWVGSIAERKHHLDDEQPAGRIHRPTIPRIVSTAPPTNRG